jgi:hypothetical protein
MEHVMTDCQIKFAELLSYEMEADLRAVASTGDVSALEWEGRTVSSHHVLRLLQFRGWIVLDLITEAYGEELEAQKRTAETLFFARYGGGA